MKGYIKSSPYFFRIIKMSMAAMVALLMGLSFFVPAPLQEPANLAQVPNPSKSAWFLLWMQELVSYSNACVYLIVFLALYFCFLPYWPKRRQCLQARWFQKDQMLVNILTLAAFVGIVTLTVVAMFFRGENWSFVVNF